METEGVLLCVAARSIDTTVHARCDNVVNVSPCILHQIKKATRQQLAAVVGDASSATQSSLCVVCTVIWHEQRVVVTYHSADVDVMNMFFVSVSDGLQMPVWHGTTAPHGTAVHHPALYTRRGHAARRQVRAVSTGLV